MVYKLVLAVSIAAAVFFIVLQLMHTNYQTLAQATEGMKNGSLKALSDSMNLLSD